MRVDNNSLTAVAGVFILDRLSRRFRWARWMQRLLPIALVTFTWWNSRRARSQPTLPPLETRN